MPSAYTLYAQEHRGAVEAELFPDGQTIKPGVVTRHMLVKWQHADPRTKARFEAMAEKAEGIRIRTRIAAFHDFVKQTGGWLAFEEETPSPATESDSDCSDSDASDPNDSKVGSLSKGSSSSSSSSDSDSGDDTPWWDHEVPLWVKPGRVPLRPAFLRPRIWAKCRGELDLSRLESLSGGSLGHGSAAAAALSSNSSGNHAAAGLRETESNLTFGENSLPEEQAHPEKWAIGTDVASLAAIPIDLHEPHKSFASLLATEYHCSSLSHDEIMSLQSPHVPALSSMMVQQKRVIHGAAGGSHASNSKHTTATSGTIPQWAWPPVVAFSTRRRLARLARARQAWSELSKIEQDRYVSSVEASIAAGALSVMFPPEEEGELRPRATTDEDERAEIKVRMDAALKLKEEAEAAAALVKAKQSDKQAAAKSCSVA